jgi:hypothetical protein
MTGRRVAAVIALAVAAAAGGTAVGAGPAAAAEHYEGSQVGPQFALVRIGQVENPLAELLKHVAVLSR